MTGLSNGRSRLACVAAFGAALLFVVGLIAFCPAAARAAFTLPLSPDYYVGNEYEGWIGSAQQLARSIYLGLLLFEFIALGFTTLLFRENVGEFLSSLGLKILVGGIFFWLIANGPALALSVKNWFTDVGTTDFGGSSPVAVIGGCLVAAYAFFAAADIAHDSVQITLVGLSIPPSCVWFVWGIGYCPVGPMASATNSHPFFVMIAQGLGLMILLGMAGIILQFAIVTIESYLVMSVGILYIGFAGSRFTMPFSQGYFSYMINVGTKLMVTYIMLGVAVKELLPILAGAGLAVLGSSLISMGFGDGLAIGGAAIAAVYVLLTMGLLWTIPAFTAALISGQSQSSGFAILQQGLSSFAGATQMMAQLGAAKHQADAARHDRAQMADIIAHAPGAGGASSASGYTGQAMAPGVQADPFAHGGNGASGSDGGASGNGGAVGGIGHQTNSGAGQLVNHLMVGGAPGQQSLPSGSSSGGSGSGPINPSNGASYDPGATSGSSGETLYGKSPEEIRNMHPGQFSSAFANTNYSLLDVNQQHAVGYHAKDANQALGDKAAQADQDGSMNLAYGLNGLAQGAQREIGQPSAVQVRISNPDKL